MANPSDTTNATKQPAQQAQPSGPLGYKPSSGALDLNRASEHDIAEIDMIGKKLAHAIVEQRELRGGFHHWEELREIAGLDAMKLAELQRAARLDDA